MEPAFKLFVNGDSEEPGAHLGIEKGVLLETVIPEFFAALGKRISAADSTGIRLTQKNLIHLLLNTQRRHNSFKIKTRQDAFLFTGTYPAWFF